MKKRFINFIEGLNHENIFDYEDVRMVIDDEQERTILDIHKGDLEICYAFFNNWDDKKSVKFRKIISFKNEKEIDIFLEKVLRYLENDFILESNYFDDTFTFGVYKEFYERKVSENNDV